MKLSRIISIEAIIELKTGLHIGAGDMEMHIGGVDNTVIKNPITNQPYIPGSSLKGKIRSLLEWKSGAVKEEPLGLEDKNKPGVLPILQLFGISGSARMTEEEARQVGPTRLSFWDCHLNKEWVTRFSSDNLLFTEVKSENTINRIRGTAEHPRFTERVPSGVQFDFKLGLKQYEGDTDELLNTVLIGLKLLEMDSLGGSGSRGYGKIAFTNLKFDGKDETARFDRIQPFSQN